MKLHILQIVLAVKTHSIWKITIDGYYTASNLTISVQIVKLNSQINFSAIS